MQGLRVDMSMLYGIFVSAKSFDIGIRSCQKREHANMLAQRVSRADFPQELVDLISDELYKLEVQTVKAMWKLSRPKQQNHLRFIRMATRVKTPANDSVMDRFVR